MCQFYKQNSGIPSSSNMESYFINIKKLLGSKSKLLRVDDFIIKHVEYLSGEIKSAICKLADFNSLGKN